MLKSARWCTAVLALALLVAGCGNKGDLYLPEPEPPPQSAPVDDDDEDA